jgi:hypothetical protein
MKSRLQRIRRTALVAGCAAFLIAIGLPLAVMGFQGLRFIASGPEQRRAAWINARALGLDARENPRAIIWAFESRFGLRPLLIRWHGALKVFGLGVSSSPRVVVGRAGWLFLARESDAEGPPERRPFAPAELDAWLRAVEARRQWAQERGIAYLLVIAPDKQTLYPEYLPPTVGPARGSSRLDQLLAHLRAHSPAVVLDLRPALRAAGRQWPVYRRTDTHWNDWAALAVTQAILEALRPRFPAARPPAAADFAIATAARARGDLAALLGLAGLWTEDQVRLVPREPRRARYLTGPLDSGAAQVVKDVVRCACPGAAIPSAVVLRDSFATALIPFLAEHFERSVYLWTYAFDPQALAKEQPSVILQEIVERNLAEPPPAP